jgi:Kef-type K+ transport system membrane component KefB/nucleotide-binding universal stress UspA family protein
MTAKITILLAAVGSSEHTVFIFLIEITLLVLLGRLLGEVMQRIGQPAVMGQLLAGVLLGPSLLGALVPNLYHTIFPDAAEQKKMIDAISQLGILMLLLLTGMETDLSVVSRMRRTAFSASLSGILLPFACGFLVGEYLPESMLPNPEQRLVTSLFLATALSISSVKIVAAVLREVDFLRRNIGQIILASAILDDTIGWILVAIIGGLAAQGTIHLIPLGLTVLGTILFLVLSFTLGKRLVAFIIRWTNDRLTIEMPVISAILILTFVMALITDYIGVHTVLGAFVAGILIGQSPILTRHIEEELRGLIVALFAPVFFGVAGLSINLAALSNPFLVKLVLLLIAIASVGKIAGGYIGGKLGKLSGREAIALGLGMNARGSTEVIIATVGLSMGVLTTDIYTLIVIMAISTTMITPPLLRWALARISPSEEEKLRLEKEAADVKNFLPKIERILIAADNSSNGKFASVLAGLFVGSQQILTTVLELEGENKNKSSANDAAVKTVINSAEMAVSSLQEAGDTPTVLTERASPESATDMVLKEFEKGYDMVFVGQKGSIRNKEGGGSPSRLLNEIMENFDGAIALVLAKGIHVNNPLAQPTKILAPTSGTDYSRRAAEVAIAIAKASQGKVTSLHILPQPDNRMHLRLPVQLKRTGRALVNEIKDLGSGESVTVNPRIKHHNVPEESILQEIEKSRYDLLVLGAKVRSSEQLFFGHGMDVLMEHAPCSIVVVLS